MYPMHPDDIADMEAIPYPNEFAAAFDTAKTQQANRHYGLYADVPAGMFALCSSQLAYCPYTDATLPNPNRSVVSLHGSRRIAQYHCDKANREDDCGGEVQYYVWPKEGKPQGFVSLPYLQLFLLFSRTNIRFHSCAF
jgi:hypothetical protein